MTPEIQARFLLDCQNAIVGEHIDRDLTKIAIRMRIDGLTQDQAYQIITFAKETVTGTKFFEGTTKDDAIADVLDGVVGYCSSICHIWSPDYDAKKALADLEKIDP